MKQTTRHLRGPLLLCGLLLAPIAGASGWAEPEQTSQCDVWGPSILVSRGDSDTSDYLARYRGECRNGKAHGQGTLDWMHRWVPGKTKATWQGRFVDGVFVGDQTVAAVAGLSGDRYLVPIGKTSGHAVLLVSRSGQTEPMDVCDIDRVLVEASPGLDLENDDNARKALEQAAKTVRDRCAEDSRDTTFELYAGKFELGPNGNWPDTAVATGSFWPSSPEGTVLGHYSNRASDRVRQETYRRERQDALDGLYRRFRQFTENQALSAWLKAEQLDANPFLWQGERVGLLVRVERMINPSQALVTNADGDQTKVLLLTGVTPETFAQPVVAVAAEVDPQRVRVDGYPQEVTQLKLVHAVACEESDCAFWLLGGESGQGIRWGQRTGNRN